MPSWPTNRSAATGPVADWTSTRTITAFSRGTSLCPYGNAMNVDSGDDSGDTAGAFAALRLHPSQPRESSSSAAAARYHVLRCRRRRRSIRAWRRFISTSKLAPCGPAARSRSNDSCKLNGFKSGISPAFLVTCITTRRVPDAIVSAPYRPRIPTVARLLRN
jgi:hypothetical protein